MGLFRIGACPRPFTTEIASAEFVSLATTHHTSLRAKRGNPLPHRDCFVATLLATTEGKRLLRPDKSGLAMTGRGITPGIGKRGRGGLWPPLLGITLILSLGGRGQVGCAYTRRVLKISTMTTITRTAPMAITIQTQIGVAGWAGCASAVCASSSA